MLKLKPKNWSNFQHYNKRTPPWVKLHRTLLDDFDYQRLPLASRALAPMLWLLASEYDDGVFDASVEFLCFRLRCSESEIRDGLKPLIDGGFFIVDSGALADCKQVSIVEAEAEGEGETKADNPPVEFAKREPDRADEIRQVFAYWQTELNHPRAKLDDKRKRKIRDRLKDGYSARDLMDAIDGVQKSPHHMGENDRATVYDDLELICRDGPHVDKFIKLSQQGDRTAMGSAARKTATAAERWLKNG